MVLSKYRNPETLRLFLRFAAVGIFGTLAHYATLIVLVEATAVGPILGSSVGFIVGALVNYVLNYRYTFQSDRRHREALPRFYVIAAVGFVFNASMMWLLVDVIGVYYVISQILATGAVLIWNFGANLVWTFAESER